MIFLNFDYSFYPNIFHGLRTSKIIFWHTPNIQAIDSPLEFFAKRERNETASLLKETEENGKFPDEMSVSRVCEPTAYSRSAGRPNKSMGFFNYFSPSRKRIIHTAGVNNLTSVTHNWRAKGENQYPLEDRRKTPPTPRKCARTTTTRKPEIFYLPPCPAGVFAIRPNSGNVSGFWQF